MTVSPSLYSVLNFVSLVGMALVLVFLVLGYEDRVLSLGCSFSERRERFSLGYSSIYLSWSDMLDLTAV